VKMSTLRLLSAIFMIAILLVLAPGCTGKAELPGTLEGTVIIGPIWPVERPGENPPVSPEVFAARKIMVYDEQGKKLMETVDITQIGQSAEGRYSIQLKPGDYVVDINKAGIDHSAEVPRTVEIKTGQTVTLDISIDTGIR